MDEDLKYKIGVTLLPGVGDVLAKSLVAHCGSAEGVFKEKGPKLQKIPGIGTIRAEEIDAVKEQVLERAGEEMDFITKKGITPLFFTDKSYPRRLTHCDDSPAMLYYKGSANLNAAKIIAIVGTRLPTDYGKDFCSELVCGLKEYGALITSGLAYGIDTAAHRSALKNGLPTVGALAHGLDQVYPPENNSLAEKMLENGGLITEFPHKTKMDPSYFPRRNRVVAGMSDAIVVIESKPGGGALITAELANNYNRDVFALPGRIGDVYSEGCNQLIKINKAALITSVKDIAYILGWEQEKAKPKQQKELFIELNEDERKLVSFLKEKDSAHIDELCYSSGLSMSKVSSLLFTLEMRGLLKTLPGKMYKLN